MQNYEKIHILLFLALNLVTFFASAQISVSSYCGTSTIDLKNSFTDVLYPATDILYTKQNKPCNKILIPVTQPSVILPIRIVLKRQNADLSWVTLSSSNLPVSVASSQFLGLPHGTYRIESTFPVKVPPTDNCPEGIAVADINGNFKGYIGAYLKPAVISQNIYIGATDQNDIKFNWIKTLGTPAPPNLANPPIYCFEENPKINTTGTVNYDRYWVAIFETGAGTSNRYTNTGWIFGKIPGNQIDLLYDVWKKNNSNWEFTPNDQFANASYSVQFAISNSCNSGWTTISNPMPFFQRRPQGWVCRNTDDDVAIAVSPNPANGYFKIPALETGEDNIQISVTDMTGRLVKQYNNVQAQYEVSELSNGIYVINVLRQGVRIHSSKLSVLN